MIPHGTASKYVTHKCRCAACREANTIAGAEQKKRRAERLRAALATVPHGHYGTYCNYGCRCGPCSADWARWLHEYKEDVA